MKLARLVLSALALGASLIACVPAGDQALTTEEKIGSVLDQLQQAPYTTRHRGLRRVEVRWNLREGGESLVYTEEIWTDGNGRFAIEPLEAMTPVEPDLFTFIAVQRNRAGFHYRYRDFHIRNRELFLENYRVTGGGPETETEMVAGRICAKAQVRRIQGESISYDLWIDIQSGMILRYVATNAGGELLASMEYLEYDAAPDLTGVQFHNPSTQETVFEPSLDLAVELPPILGFDPFLPERVPEGYTLAEAARVVGPFGRNWLKLTYHDGVETLFFLHGGSLDDEVAHAANYSNQPFGAATSGDQVLVYPSGPITVAQGTLRSNQLIAIGKLDAEELIDMIGSSLPK